MSIRFLLSRGIAAALLCLLPQLAAAQVTTGPGAPTSAAAAELFGRDELGFDTAYQGFAQTFQPFVGGGTTGYLQSFTVYMQAANFDDPTVMPAFDASIWTIGSGPALSLSTLLRETSGPTGSAMLEGWKAVTFDFTNLQLTKNVTYAFVLGVTGYASLTDGALNYVAMNDGSASGAVFAALNGSDPVNNAGWMRLESGDANAPRTLAYSATFTTTAVPVTVPEPSAVVLLTLGVALLLMRTRRRAA